MHFVNVDHAHSQFLIENVLYYLQAQTGKNRNQAFPMRVILFHRGAFHEPWDDRRQGYRRTLDLRHLPVDDLLKLALGHTIVE